MAEIPISDFLAIWKSATGLNAITSTLQNAATTIGNGDVAEVDEYNTAVVEVEGTFEGTIVFEGSINNTTWYPIYALNFSDGSVVNSASDEGLYELKIGGLTHFRTRISEYTSGSITTKVRFTVLG